ncbi:hypothetical protein GGX14DRAFT_693001 [Mycena pura]|uniref:Uncharacterized protein n=1 Tax=Mycena pura TaxID=153505 RepID=A0AAD6YQR2_9AGAR|nr:hypothetical protein GGX14DRAFT_693001 [Mycena pura]
MSGDSEIQCLGDSAIRCLGDSAIRRFGDSAIRRFGGSQPPPNNLRRNHGSFDLGLLSLIPAPASASPWPVRGQAQFTSSPGCWPRSGFPSAQPPCVRRPELPLQDGPSKAPEDRQRCIDNLGVFMSAVLRGVSEYTGLHAVAIFGGPMPVFGGELRTVTVSHGRNHDVGGGCQFPNWSKARFARDILDFMKEYLHTAFTPAECAEAALPQEDDSEKTLARAKYTISQESAHSDDSDEDSDLDASDTSSHDSDVDSDMEEDVRAGKANTHNRKRGDKAKESKKKTGGKDKGKRKLDEGNRRGGEERTRKRARRDLERGSGDSEPDAEAVGSTPSGGQKKTSRAHAKPDARKTRQSARGLEKRSMLSDDLTGENVEMSEVRTEQAESQHGPLAPRGVAGTSSTLPPNVLLNSRQPSPDNPDEDPIPLCPEDAAPWFKALYAEVTYKNLGRLFNALLRVFVDLERNFQWQKGAGKSLGSKNRPSQIASWVSVGRGTRGGPMGKGAGPCIGSVADFEKEWWLWWGTLQPKWRERIGANLRFPGQNGALNLVATLYWWGMKLSTCSKRDQRESWVDAVTDVTWMLQGLLAAESPTQNAELAG